MEVRAGHQPPTAGELRAGRPPTGRAVGQCGLARWRRGSAARRLGAADWRALRRSPGDRRARRQRDGWLLWRPVHAAWSANPSWIPSFDDFPLTSVEVKASLFRRPRRRAGRSCCRTSRASQSVAWPSTAIATASSRSSRASLAPAPRSSPNAPYGSTRQGGPSRSGHTLRRTLGFPVDSAAVVIRSPPDPTLSRHPPQSGRIRS